MSELDLVVIGGGVAGITAARYAQRAGRRVVLLEADDRLGGCAHTWQPVADFWLELGAHTAYNSYGTLLALNADARFGNLLPRAKVGYHFLRDGRPQSPFARVGFLEAALRLPFNLGLGKAGLDVETYFTRLLGPGNWHRLLAPAFAAVLSQPAGPYPAEWLFKRKARVKAAPRKFTHAGGMQGWLSGLADGVEVRLGQRVDSLAAGPDGVELKLADATLRAREVAVATPPDVAARLLAPLLPELAAGLAATPMAGVDTHAVVVPAGKVALPPVAGLIGAEDAYFSAVSRDYLPHPAWRGFAFHFKPGRLDAGGRRAKIAEVLGCGVADFAYETTKTNRLPALTPASVVLAGQLRAALAGTPVRLVGNYLNGLSLGDTALYAETGG
ncbi:FAD-dependent oxidoreductase [Parasulfuritortus cantonensis]|uniref:FAD-dependent oxidoreductase n=1 Tax=Parasulfuritortus cantonensis TaxID=2528202 RepID=A0A4R1B2Z1_9PROT|nr:FAD-dependent oxidoreductase [Parasulfuritortus cantonensis]TCJ11830.1 FAD-dependent oxidoreductase [Parasulfuritortus cantonensis]